MNIYIVGIKLVYNKYLDKLSEYGFMSFINAYQDQRLISDTLKWLSIEVEQHKLT